MNPQKWQKIKEIFNQAVELPKPERSDFLARYVVEDAEMLLEIEKMLAFAEEDNDALEENAFNYLNDEKESPMPEKIGVYKLVREIGRGGMGVVYEAMRETKDFRQKVALKVIKRGMDTDAILSRFRHEQQILATLEHPNIARFLDGGMTAEGLAFYAMEFVEGVYIDDYCREKDLSVEDCLRLFRQICSAVQYAHQNLVVHRDLKPSNILVTSDGTPKLLDFGISKLLEPNLSETHGTATALGMMTPAYASPEQIRGERVNTATDIYSLGVILFEILTGQRPYKISSTNQYEIQKVICESEPVAPSRVWREAATQKNGDTEKNRKSVTKMSVAPKFIASATRLKGDLDNILLKALRKEPSQRYASVGQLSEDIRRHLEGLPITARPATFTYRAAKFIRRNRIPIIAAGVVFFSLLIGIGIALRQTYQAEQQRILAEKRFTEVRQIANKVVFTYTDAITNLPNSSAVREMILQDASSYLDNLAHDAKNDVALQRELAAAYVKLSDLQGAPYGGGMGDTAKAIETMNKAIAIEEAVFSAHPNDKEIKQNIIGTYIKFGNLIYVFGNADETLRIYSKAEKLLKELLADEPENTQLLRQLVVLQMQIGSFHSESHLEMDVARSYMRQALEMAQKIVTLKPDDSAAQSLVASTNMRMGMLLGYPETSELNDLNGAAEKFYTSLALRRKIIQKDLSNKNQQRQYATALFYLGDVLLWQGKINEAISSYEEAYQKSSEFIARDSNDFFARSNAVVTLSKLGRALYLNNQKSAGIEKMREASKRFEEFGAENKFDSATQNGYVIHLLSLGEILRREELFSEAEKVFRRALEVHLDTVRESKGFEGLETNGSAIYASLGVLQAQKAETVTGKEREKILNEAAVNLEKGLVKFRELKARKVLFERFKDLDVDAENALSEIQKHY